MNFPKTCIAQKWGFSYLENHKQKVKIQDCIAVDENIQMGVPQGYELGPTFSLISVSKNGKLFYNEFLKNIFLSKCLY